MNPEVRLFLEAALTLNIVFVLFVGMLVPIFAELTVRRSLTAGLKHALLVALAGVTGSALIHLVAVDAPYWAPAIIASVSLASVSLLRRWGELQGEWAGIPRSLLALAPVSGVQFFIWTSGVSGLDAVIVSFGAGLGYYFGIVIVVTTIEQIRLAEAPWWSKRLGTLLFAVAVFALGFAGFQFL